MPWPMPARRWLASPGANPGSPIGDGSVEQRRWARRSLCPADLSDPEAVSRVAEATRVPLGAADILVNAAGVKPARACGKR